MDEARAVLERLERIESLDRTHASPSQLLAEVRSLLAEAEAWLAVEGGGTRRAERAVERCRVILDCELAPAIGGDPA